jgi:hypothetical protein
MGKEHNEVLLDMEYNVRRGATLIGGPSLNILLHFFFPKCIGAKYCTQVVPPTPDEASAPLPRSIAGQKGRPIDREGRWG